MTMVKLAPFDPARHLDNPQVISAYLAEAMRTGDPKLILRAIANIVRSGRVSNIARQTGMSRTSLYWTEKTSPEFTTVLKVLGAMGVHLEPMANEPPSAGQRREQRHRRATAVAPPRRPHGARPH
jgi:probable addiction module antidote protein